MNSIISAITDLLTVCATLSFLTTFSLELKNELIHKLIQGTPKLSSYTNTLTGDYLDLSDKRVYGK